MKTGNQPGSWDAWILSASGVDGRAEFDRNIDLQDGDMFWDIAALPGDRLVAVGSTAYVQNPVGASVSDARDPLALVLDSRGNVQTRIALPRGPAGRGNEAMSVGVGDRIAISGVQNAPGTHAQVHSDAFLSVRDPM